MNSEAKVLSSLLKNKDITSVMNYNASTLFDSHKDIWKFIYEYYKNHLEVPPVSVVLESFEDFDYSDQLEGTTKHYAEMLKAKKAQQELENIIKGASKTIATGTVPVDRVLAKMSQRIADIQKISGYSRAVDIRNIDEATNHYDRVRQMSLEHGGQPGIKTGFKYIDEYYPTGIAPGHFIVVLGYSGHFKSWFGIKLMINAWLQGHTPLIINLEMTPEELRDRILFLISNYSMSDLVKAQIPIEEFRVWAEDFMKEKVPFHLVGNESYGEFTTEMIQAKIEQYKPDLVLLDYLQLFSDRGMSNSEIERAKRTAREVNQIAKVSKTPIVAVTAVTGKDKKDRLNPPEISQVAWSSEIEYAANLAIAVHTMKDPETQKPLNTEIICRKNRHGGMFDFFVKMDMENGVVTEIDAEEQLNFMETSEEELDFLLEE